MPRLLPLLPAIILALVTAPAATSAQEIDFTLFLGRAYPVYDERLTVRLPAPSLQGVDVTVTGTPEIRADGGPVFGAALAVEMGVLGIEGRLDATDIGFDLTGARYDLIGVVPPAGGLTGRVTLGDGRFDVERLYLLSLNLRLRTPGPAGLVASGGLTYLPEIGLSGSVPLSAELAGIPVAGPDARLRLLVAPTESAHRFGANAGAGLRVGGNHVAFMAEARVFAFRDYDLRFALDDVPEIVADLVGGLGPIRFQPIIVNAQAGLVFKF